MKTLKCDLCDHEARGETFEEWMKALMPHWMDAHADVMKDTHKMSEEDQKKHQQKWMAENKARFDAAKDISKKMKEIMKNPVGWFEIPVTNLDRAEKFYKDLLGLDCDRQEKKENGITMSWFPMEMKEYGTAGTLVLGEHFTPSHEGTLVYFSCSRVDETLKKAEDMGVKIFLPRIDIGEHGFIAWLEDSEGNRIAIHSRNG